MGKTSGNAAFRGPSFAFTEARVEAARRAAADLDDADSSGRRSWRDDACRGLVLRVNVGSGRAAWYYVGKVGGQATRRPLGDVDVVRLEEARQAVGRIRFDTTAAAALAPRPGKAAPEDPADTTPLVGVIVADMLEAHAAGRWLPGNRSRRPTDRTMTFYADLRRATLADHEGLTLKAFAEQLPAIHAAIAKRAPVQANRAAQLVRNLFAYAADAGLWRGPNPAAGTGKADRLARATEEPRQRVLTDAEMKRLDTAMKADSPLWRHLFLFSTMTLQRMGAVCHARWEDVVLEGKDAAWTVPKKYMKGRKSAHRIPLADMPQLLEILRSRRAMVPDDCPWIFPGEDGEPARNYDKAWDRIIRRAGLWSKDREQRPRPHDLRRTGGARMTERGVPLSVVVRALGDAPSSAAMVSRTYALATDAALRDAFKATARRGRRR